MTRPIEFRGRATTTIKFYWLEDIDPLLHSHYVRIIGAEGTRLFSKSSRGWNKWKKGNFFFFGAFDGEKESLSFIEGEVYVGRLDGGPWCWSRSSKTVESLLRFLAENRTRANKLSHLRAFRERTGSPSEGLTVCPRWQIERRWKRTKVITFGSWRDFNLGPCWREGEGRKRRWRVSRYVERKKKSSILQFSKIVNFNPFLTHSTFF